MNSTTITICLALLIALTTRAAATEVDRPISLKPNGYFGFGDGTAFVPLGGFYANWPGKETVDSRVVLPPRDLMPASNAPYLYPYTEEIKSDLRNWFSYLRREGVTSLRLMLRSMDVVGRVHHERLKAVLEYLDIARDYGIRFQVVLFDDYDKPPYTNKSALEQLAIPYYTQQQLAALPLHRKRFLVEKKLTDNKFTDPDVLKCRQDYLDELLPVFMGRPEIYAYELENEQDPNSVEWVTKIVAYIKSIDPVTTVIGNPVSLNARTFYHWSRTGLDAFNLHPYNHGDSKNASNVYNATRAKQALALLPSFNGESGMNRTCQAKAPEWEAAQNARDNIWPTIAAGAAGCLMWVPEYRGEVEEFSQAARILREFDLSDFNRDTPDIRVFQNSDQVNDLPDAMRWTGFCMRTGFDFDLIIGPARPSSDTGGMYSAEDLPTPVKVAGAWRPFEVTSGYFVQPLVGNGRAKGLVYLANIAGGIKAGSDAQWLRNKASVDLRLKARLGADEYRIRIYDLDRRECSELATSGDSWIPVGKTSHDYVITFERQQSSAGSSGQRMLR